MEPPRRLRQGPQPRFRGLEPGEEAQAHTRGAFPLGEEAPLLVGLSEATTCYVSPEYFAEHEPLADFIVHVTGASPHFLTASRDDPPFWRANRHELTLSDTIRDKLETWKVGLTVNMPVASEEAYYGNFESYYCILAGMGWMPEQPLPTLRYRPSSIARSVEAFQNIKLKQQDLLQRLPSHYEFLKRLHRQEGMDLAPTGTR